MGRVYARAGALYLDYDLEGKRVRQPSGFKVGQEAEAEERLAGIEAKVTANVKAKAAIAARLGEDGSPITVRQYAKKWIARRRKSVPSAGAEDSRLSNHVLPRIGNMAMTEVRPRHVRDLVLALRAVGDLAPRTVRDAYGILRRMFRSAVTDELVVANPCVLEDGILPPNVDKDPEWRDEAIYTRSEVEQLISDERIRADRRVVYGLKVLAALRHGEAAALRWKHYDPDFKPLGRILVANSFRGRHRSSKGTKTGVTRWVPVHPVLAAMLAEWRLAGWDALCGRKPKDEDLIVPTDELTPRHAKDAQDALQRDLERLELRTAAASMTRRGHDFRATLTTLAQDDGAAPHLIEMMTHGQPSATISQKHYTRVHALWPAICTELAKLRIERREGKLIELPRVAVAGVAPVLAGDLGTNNLAQPWHKQSEQAQVSKIVAENSRKKQTPRSPCVEIPSQPSQPKPRNAVECKAVDATSATGDRPSSEPFVPFVPFGAIPDGESAENDLAAALTRARDRIDPSTLRRLLIRALAELE